jgi:hypothetical protein
MRDHLAHLKLAPEKLGANIVQEYQATARISFFTLWQRVMLSSGAACATHLGGSPYDIGRLAAKELDKNFPPTPLVTDDAPDTKKQLLNVRVLTSVATHHNVFIPKTEQGLMFLSVLVRQPDWRKVKLPLVHQTMIGQVRQNNDASKILTDAATLAFALTVPQAKREVELLQAAATTHPRRVYHRAMQVKAMLSEGMQSSAGAFFSPNLPPIKHAIWPKLQALTETPQPPAGRVIEMAHHLRG